MFITFTIDTNQKKSKKVRLKRRRFNAASGWRRTVFSKKRGLWQRFKAWRKSLKTKQYKFGDQMVIF